MTDSVEPADHAERLKRALVALDKMQAKIDRLQAAARQPIAIIGMGCRLPGGVDSPDSFWRLLEEGRHAVTEVPPSRWDIDAYYDPDPNRAGKMYTRHGAFLDDFDMFDARFFGIAPRKAESMDPQQRILLEVTWEALEHAAQAPDALDGSRTGVYVGMVNCDHLRLAFADDERIDANCGPGNALSIAPGRLSYTLGLAGPALGVDTACSSSLVAIHLACQSLRTGECDMALAGGVNLILLPQWSINFCRAGMLAPDGRSKTFDAAADGFVRGEGCGMIVLRRLSDARAAGDNILAVIRGSAVNQDGRSTALTAPNGKAQQAVIRAALDAAGARPDEVSFVEAHGTGTSLGDPIEVQALAEVLRVGRPTDRPAWIGSVKTNIGHTEATAGVAAVIKVVLSLQRGLIPRHLHLETPSPLVAWDRTPLVIPTQTTPWERTDRPRLAGVSAFGFSGTNAHLLVEEPPALANSEHDAPSWPWHLLCLSAKNESALADLAGRFARFFHDHPQVNLADVGYTLAVGRADFDHRLALVVDTGDKAARLLESFPAEQPVPGLFSGRRDAKRGPDKRVQAAELVGSLDKSDADWRQLMEDLAARYVGGAKIDWRGFESQRPRRRLALPTYPFQRKRFWIGRTAP